VKDKIKIEKAKLAAIKKQVREFEKRASNIEAKIERLTPHLIKVTRARDISNGRFEGMTFRGFCNFYNIDYPTAVQRYMDGWTLDEIKTMTMSAA